MWAFPPSREATTPLQAMEIRASAHAASQGGLLSTKARRAGATVDTQFNRRGGDADQGDAIEGESAVMSLPSIQWKPATTDQRAEMVRQLATTTLWQLYMSQSAAHDEIHVASARDEWLAESQADLAVFARRKFKAGELVLLPFNHCRGGHFQEAGGSHAPGDGHHARRREGHPRRLLGEAPVGTQENV